LENLKFLLLKHTLYYKAETAQTYIQSNPSKFGVNMFGKKGQGMHMFGGLDIVIVLIGVFLGMFLVYYGINAGWLPSDMFCGSVAAPVA